MSPGRFSTPPLPPEDDWFAEGGDPPSTGREPRPPAASAIESGMGPGEPPDGRPGSERERRLLVAAIAGALVLLVGGILVARALTGSDGGDETTTPTLPTTTSGSSATTTATTTATTPTTRTTTTTPSTTTVPTGTTPSATLPATLPESLRPGDESETVRQVQAALVELGYLAGGVDGKFGPATEQAVRDFQTASGLDDDGVVGTATLAALAAALDAQ